MEVCDNHSMSSLATEATVQRSATASLAKNSAANVIRVGFTSLVAIILPAYLTHHLPVAIYGAWVLILQLGAYVSYLDFGVQTAVSKYIAEYEANGDLAGCSRCASVGLAIMAAACIAGVMLTLGLAWAVPRLFAEMPSTLYRDVRISIVFVGISLSLNLLASIFSAIFLGLQRYQVPLVTNVTSKVFYAIAVLSSVYFHSSLAVMGASVALANVIGALLQVMAWKRLANHIRLSIFAIDKQMLRQMAGYCLVLTIWSVCMLLIGGVDLTIVGHYDFRQVAFYSIGTSPTTFILMLMGAILGPLLPASSALSTRRTAEQMGDLLLRATRYGTVILLTSGLPVMVAGYFILRAWVGANYALHSVQFLRILLLANIIRHLCAPYAIVVVATAKQWLATASAVSEALVNVCASIILARHYGAMGVALGTLIGAVVGVAMHFGLSMHYTRNIAVSRLKLFLQGIFRPAVMALPSLFLLPAWWYAGAPALGWRLWFLWGCVTVLTGWLVSMSRQDRTLLLRLTSRGERFS
jgi:O-antigen/teichoic acid export membrane protein